MPSSLGSEARSIEPSDERPHEHGAEPAWTERIVFNLFDEQSGFGGIASLDYRPATRKASGEIDVFMPGGAVATALARAADVKRAEMTVGRMSFECVEEMKTWKLKCSDIALVFPNAESASLAGKTERAGKAAQLELEITFHAWGDPAGWGARRTDVNEQGFTSIVSSGSFEQAGRFEGKIRVGGESASLDGHGFRARAWGVPGDRGGFWYAAAFGEDLAVSMGRTHLSGDELTHGRVWRAGRMFEWQGAGRESISGGKLEMLLDDVGGQDVRVSADLLATIPPRAGEPEVYRSLARFQMGAREALGLVETSVLTL